MKKLFFTLLLAAAVLPGWADETQMTIIGGATSIGWWTSTGQAESQREYQRTVGRMVRTAENTWVWVGTLTNGSGDAGCFKITNGSGNTAWDGYWAPSENKEVGNNNTEEFNLSTEKPGGNDWKFYVTTTGMYRITIDLSQSTKTMKVEKLTEPSKVGDYYQLGTVEEFMWFAGKVTSEESSTAKAKLTTDISFSGKNFFPLACERNKFEGELDGGGYTIDYAVINDPRDYVGLFRYLAPGANIHDLVIGSHCSFTGSNNLGGVAGKADGNGTVTLSKVINCATIHANNTANGTNAAGLVAFADGATVNATNCANLGQTSTNGGEAKSAAFIGWIATGASFTNCWNGGTINDMDGSNNLYRTEDTQTITVDNCYDVSGGNYGQGTQLATTAKGSGELCYKLNDLSVTSLNWYQTLGTDNYPVPFSSHGEMALSQNEGWYEISEPWQLRWMAEAVNMKNSTYGNKNIKLTADINYSAFTDQAAMIGKPSNTYKGTFDGQYHIVTVAFNNVAERNSANDNDERNQTALFRRVNGGTIKNLKVTGSITTDMQFAAGICSGIWDNGSIQNCISDVTITDSYPEAGYNSTVKSDATHGGILAYVQNADGSDNITVSNCLFSGTINSPYRVGSTGVVGWTANNTTNVHVKNCLVTGTLTLKNSDSNGIISRSSANYSDNYYTCSVTGASIKKDNGTEASAQKGTGELCYLLNGSTQGGTNWTQSLGTDDYPIPFNTQRLVYLNTSTYSNTFIKDGKYQLANASDLVDFSALVNGNTANKGANAELTNDIDMDGITDYTPIGTDPSNKYCGTFDGKGHRIKNLKIDTDTKEQGLFSVCEGATIKNLIMDASCSIKCTNTDKYGSAAFVAVCNGSGTLSFINCGNEASVYGGKSNNAAFLGFNHSSGLSVSLTNCYNTGAISGGYDDCAMIGWNGSNAYTMTNCYNKGTISNTHSDGNTWGRSSGNKTLDNCYTTQSCSSIEGLTSSFSSDKVSSGELCYLLKGTQETNAFTQAIGTDAYPTFGSATVDRGQWFSDDYIYYNVDESGNITVNELNLDDTKTTYNVPAKVTAKSVTLTRTLHALTADGTQSRWNTFCSPVAIAKSNFSAAKELTGVTANGNNYSMTFKDVEGDILEAGKPYMVQVSEGKSSLKAENVAVAAAGTSTSSETFNGLTFTGNFTNGNAPLGSFIISNNVFYLVDTDTNTDGISEVALKAFRGYITTTSGTNVKALDFTFDDDATGISLMEDGRSQMEDGAIYNLAGQRINKMQRGINIVNGKKILK